MLCEAVDLYRKVCPELLALRIGEAEVGEDNLPEFRRGVDSRSVIPPNAARWRGGRRTTFTDGVSYFSRTAVEMLFLAIHAANPCSSNIPLATASMV